MSSTHCLGKRRDNRRERVAAHRATNSTLRSSAHHDCVTKRTPTGESLFDAINKQDYDHVVELLQSHVDPSQADQYGRTPLHVASTKSDAGIVKTLIDHGADVNIEDSIGNTPLNLACTSGQIAIVGVLLRAGARLSSTKLHPTPLVVALTRLQSMMVDDKLSISSAEVRKAILELINLIRRRKLSTHDNLTDLCDRLENLQSHSNEDIKDDEFSLDSLLSNLTISIYKNPNL